MGRKKQEHNFVRHIVKETGQNERTIYRKLRRVKVLDYNKEWETIGVPASIIDIVSIGTVAEEMLLASDIYLGLIKEINKKINNMNDTVKLFKHWHKEFKSYCPKRLQTDKPIPFAKVFEEKVIDEYLPSYLNDEYSNNMSYWIEEKQQLDTYKLIINCKNIKLIEHIKKLLEDNL